MSTPSGSASVVLDRDGQPERIGTFRIVGILGRGGMGVVYDALGAHGEKVALKVIRPQGDSDHQALLVARFLREAKILEQLDHPGVVRMLDSGDADGVLFLAMERIEGVSLLTIRRQGPLGYDPLLHLGVQLADTLAHMHQAGVVHRDIKPANILIDGSGRPIITDFGISGMDGATGITRMGDLLGSPGFMAPEVTEGQQPSELSDQFALGRLLYELGANGPAKRLPKNAPILEILNASLEIDWNRFPRNDRWPTLESVLRRMVARLPEDRYPHASAVKASLQALSSSDLLDLDTLSEHVGSLGLVPKTSWEAEVPEALDPKGLRPNLDDDLANLERPAGERTERADRAEALFTERTAIDPRALQPERHPQFSDLRSEDVTQIPLGPTVPDSPVEFMPKVMSLETDRKSEAITMPPPPQALPPDQLRPLSLSFPPPVPAGSAMATAGMPLYEIQRKRDQESSDVRPIPQGLEPAEAQIPRLERQIARLKEQLHAQRIEQAPKPRPLLTWALIVVITAAISVVGTVALNPMHRPTPIVLVTPGEGPLAAQIASYRGAGTPSNKDLSDAAGMHAAALEELSKKDLDSAEALLKQCVEIADLPECHRTLATLLSLSGNPAARTHFERYLSIVPDAPDAEQIRRALRTR
jgi:serine/threonine protein kinase